MVSSDQTKFDKCELELYLSPDNRKVHYIDINDKFNVGFLIAPYKTKYYMQVNCDGYIYRTIDYELPLKEHGVPIDLGKITIDKATAKRNK